MEETLRQLEIGDRPQLLALNKMDLVRNNGLQPFTLDSHHETVPVSAVTGWNTDALLDKVQSILVTEWAGRVL